MARLDRVPAGRDQGREFPGLGRGVVLLGGPAGAGPAHPELGRVGRQGLGHRLDQRLDGPGRDQPAVPARLDQLRDAGDGRAITGRPRAIASMITTGSPSAKLGSTSARAASSSRRTPWLSRKPVIRTRSRRPARSMSRSSSPRNGPSPTMTSSKSEAPVLEPGRRLDQQELALLLGQPPHVHQPRPIRDGSPSPRRKTPSRPQRTTWIFDQSSVAHHRQSWLRVKWLMATTKSA